MSGNTNMAHLVDFSQNHTKVKVNQTPGGNSSIQLGWDHGNSYTRSSNSNQTFANTGSGYKNRDRSQGAPTGNYPYTQNSTSSNNPFANESSNRVGKKYSYNENDSLDHMINSSSNNPNYAVGNQENQQIGGGGGQTFGQRVDLRSTSNIGGQSGEKPTIKLNHPPGGQSNFTIGGDYNYFKDNSSKSIRKPPLPSSNQNFGGEFSNNTNSPYRTSNNNYGNQPGQGQGQGQGYQQPPAQQQYGKPPSQGPQYEANGYNFPIYEQVSVNGKYQQPQGGNNQQNGGSTQGQFQQGYFPQSNQNYSQKAVESQQSSGWNNGYRVNQPPGGRSNIALG